ncbi:MAG: aldehyde ferredoxin oxidoreductase, partial [Desulfobacterales bacterium]|nr:aldehyde ferredoxin oxidoreductase [Desulfobacterales bacterium]
MIFSGNSPSWGGFYISSMGGAALIFDNLGINMLSIVNKSQMPSILYLNRIGGEEIEVKIVPINLQKIWNEGRRGIYSLMDYVFQNFAYSYQTEPRILVVGPAAESTDFGAIVSVPIADGKLTSVDTWAGRGGLGTKLLKEHGICAIIYGGTFIDQDFRDRKVADQWFINKYQKKLAAKDLEATAKYRFE